VRSRRWFALGLLSWMLSGCRFAGDVVPTISASPMPRATPYASEPAAGICADATGAVGASPPVGEVVMTLEPGIPDPRCMIVAAGQRLRVVNATGGDVNISLGPFSLPLPANAETVIGPAFGDYLMPGVHALQVDPCCGGEVWLQE
jgi:hypothetical protein